MSASQRQRPLILGLTGSIGMGKSTVALMLREAGVPVFDADAAVHRLQGPDGALVPMIEAAFPGTTGPDGVDRPALSAEVFGRPERMKRLEAIVHPAVAEERGRFVARHSDAPIVCFDIPLLFETGGEKNVDAIMVVSAPAAVQRERVLARAHMSDDKFESILAIQVPDAEKRARADFIVENGGSVEETAAQVSKIVSKLRDNPGKWLASRAGSADIR